MGLFKSNRQDKNNSLYEESYNDIPDYSGYCPGCPICGTTMGFNYVKAEFKCPNCKHIMDESDWDYEFIYDDPDNPPYGCEACGGPWPHCKSSCKLFDE